MEYAANKIGQNPAVSAITMPLIRLLRDGGLSWSDKCEVAAVIRQVLIDHDNMNKERAHLGSMAGAMAQQCQSVGGLDKLTQR